MKRHALFVGRWQPFHKGHEWLIRQKLDKGIPVLIAIRDMDVNDENPFTPDCVANMLRLQFAKEDVEIVIIPDIESINYGRSVGYEVNEYEVPHEISRISATEIREYMNRNDDSWKQKVPEKIAKYVEKILTKEQGHCIWFTGLPCSGKTTLALELKRKLESKGHQVTHFDGDILRKGLCSDLKFTPEDRDENIRRVIFLSKMLTENQIIVIASFISPYRDKRRFARRLINNFVEVYVKCPLKICEKRDIKGMYSKARSGIIKDFTGVSATYEEPEHAEIVLNTHVLGVESCIDKIMGVIDES